MLSYCQSEWHSGYFVLYYTCLFNYGLINRKSLPGHGRYAALCANFDMSVLYAEDAADDPYLWQGQLLDQMYDLLCYYFEC